MVIVLDKTYRKEPIPGLLSLIAIRVHARSNDMLELKNPPFGFDIQQRIIQEFDTWEAERAYAACPFAELLNAYPGPKADMNKLYEYEKRLRGKTSDIKEMNEWANNIITIIHKELMPPKSWIN